MDSPDNTPNPPTQTQTPRNTNTQTPSGTPNSNNPIMDELIQIMIARFGMHSHSHITHTHITYQPNEEHLVQKGFLKPQFLGKIRNDPKESLRFIRQNRNVVKDQLDRKLNPKIRQTPQQLELKGLLYYSQKHNRHCIHSSDYYSHTGIVPKGYFTKGHQNAMTRKHRRKSSAAQDLAVMISLRPKPEVNH